MYEHLLVALDGSSAAEKVLEHTEALAKAFGSTVTLLRATVAIETLIAETAISDNSLGGSPLIDPTPILQAEQDDAVDYLNGVAARLRQHNLNVSVEHPEADPAQAIIERARVVDASMILMTTHGRSGLGRVVFGSVADAVIRHATCPVLLVRVIDPPDA